MFTVMQVLGFIVGFCGVACILIYALVLLFKFLDYLDDHDYNFFYCFTKEARLESLEDKIRQNEIGMKYTSMLVLNKESREKIIDRVLEQISDNNDPNKLIRILRIVSKRSSSNYYKKYMNCDEIKIFENDGLKYELTKDSIKIYVKDESGSYYYGLDKIVDLTKSEKKMIIKLLKTKIRCFL